MSYEFEMNEAALDAFEEAISWHTVGIAHTLNGVTKSGIGTGVAVNWQGSAFILTADHVVAETSPVDFGFFFRPTGNLRRAVPGEPATLRGVGLSPVSSLAVLSIGRDRHLDVACLRIPIEICDNEPLRPLELGADSTVPPVGTPVLLRGHPFDLTKELQPRVRVTFASHEWTRVTDSRPSGHIESNTQFFIQYTSADQWLPHGFSGGGIWYQHEQTDVVWAPTPRLAGIATSYFRKSGLIMGIRIAEVIKFLDRAAPDR